MSTIADRPNSILMSTIAEASTKISAISLRSDNICKYLASEYPQQFVRWLFASDATDIELLPTELSREPIRADTVILLQSTNRILHLEFQTLPESTPPLPLRMLDYWVRLYRQYSLPIEQVVICSSCPDRLSCRFITANCSTGRYD